MFPSLSPLALLSLSFLFRRPSLLPPFLHHRGRPKTAQEFCNTVQKSPYIDTRVVRNKHRLWREVGKSEDKQKSSVTQSREQDMRREEAGTTTGCAFLPCAVRESIPLWQEHTLAPGSPEIVSWRACALFCGHSAWHPAWFPGCSSCFFHQDTFSTHQRRHSCPLVSTELARVGPRG